MKFCFCWGQVLVLRGKEDVDAVLPDYSKKSSTIIASINASGEKFSPLFIAKGKTPRSHAQFEGMTANDEEYGNSHNEVMGFYLHKLSFWMKHQECALILDRRASHISNATQKVG